MINATKTKKLAYAGITAISAIGLSACNSSGSSTSGMLNSITAGVTTNSAGDLIATISTNLDTSSYGIAELNIPVVDPKNPTLQYGDINITPTVCSPTATTCLEGGTLNLSIDVTSFVHINSVATTLPNGTPFPINFASPSTKVYATTVGAGGGKVYGAIGGGTYLIGAAIPYSGLTGAGSYTPGLDVFGTVSSGNVTTYIGYFAGAEGSIDQTGVGVFADLSSLVSATVAKSGVEAENVSKSVNQLGELGGVAKASSVAKPSNGSEQKQQMFLYNLWKQGQEKHTVLHYE